MVDLELSNPRKVVIFCITLWIPYYELKVYCRIQKNTCVTLKMLKFGSRSDSNIVFKCTVRLLEDTEILECEYKVNKPVILYNFRITKLFFC